MGLGKLFNQYNKLVGKAAGSSSKYDIYRPDYTVSNQGGTLVSSGKSCRLDTRALAWAEPSLAQGMYFDMFLDRDLIQVGDVLYPFGVTPSASSIGSLPVVTVGSVDNIKPCVGMLTDIRGAIADGGDIIYSNVRWQWASPGTPKAGAVPELEQSMPFDRRKVLLYRRQGIGMPTPLVTGMQLVDHTDGINKTWNILDILSVGNYTQLQVEEDSR